MRRIADLGRTLLSNAFADVTPSDIAIEVLDQADEVRLNVRYTLRQFSQSQRPLLLDFRASPLELREVTSPASSFVWRPDETESQPGMIRLPLTDKLTWDGNEVCTILHWKRATPIVLDLPRQLPAVVGPTRKSAQALPLMGLTRATKQITVLGVQSAAGRKEPSFVQCTLIDKRAGTFASLQKMLPLTSSLDGHTSSALLEQYMTDGVQRLLGEYVEEIERLFGRRLAGTCAIIDARDYEGSAPTVLSVARGPTILDDRRLVWPEILPGLANMWLSAAMVVRDVKGVVTPALAAATRLVVLRELGFDAIASALVQKHRDAADSRVAKRWSDVRADFEGVSLLSLQLHAAIARRPSARQKLAEVLQRYWGCMIDEEEMYRILAKQTLLT